MSDRTSAILRERARALAREDARTPHAAGEQLEVLVFQLAWESYGVETALVREVHPLKDLTPIPCTPPFVLGIVNLRGELCPVIDLKRLFGLPESSLTNATSTIILRDAAMEFGLIADVIVGVDLVDAAEMHPPPATFSGVNASFVKGITKELLTILDGARILGHPGLIVDEQVGE